MARPRSTEPPKDRVTFRTESALIGDLKRLAKKDDRVLASYIRRTLAEHVAAARKAGLLPPEHTTDGGGKGHKPRDAASA